MNWQGSLKLYKTVRWSSKSWRDRINKRMFLKMSKWQWLSIRALQFYQLYCWFNNVIWRNFSFVYYYVFIWMLIVVIKWLILKVESHWIMKASSFRCTLQLHPCLTVLNDSQASSLYEKYCPLCSPQITCSPWSRHIRNSAIRFKLRPHTHSIQFQYTSWELMGHSSQHVRHFWFGFDSKL